MSYLEHDDPKEDPLLRIEARLRELDEFDQALYELIDLNPLHHLADEVELLARADEVEVGKQVVAWLVRYNAGSCLLRAVGQAAGSRPALHSLLVRILRYWDDDSSSDDLGITDAVAVSLPTMAPELRSVAFLCAPSLRESNAWKEGTDYANLEYRPVSNDAPSRAEEELALLESVDGRRHWLELLGYRSNDPPGTWQLGCRSAVTLFQLDNGLDATGVVDEATAESLEALGHCFIE